VDFSIWQNRYPSYFKSVRHENCILARWGISPQPS
jgi:hypothetical protein